MTPAEVALPLVGLLLLAAVVALVLRAGRGGPPGAGVVDPEPIEGVLDAERFRIFAEPWLSRGLRDGTASALVLIASPDLDDIAHALGADAARAVDRRLARAAVSDAPAASLVGRLAPGRIAVLTMSRGEPHFGQAIERLHDAALGDENDVPPVVVTIGIATTERDGTRYADLMAAAERSVSADVPGASTRPTTPPGAAPPR